jgi:hypothetical protein
MVRTAGSASFGVLSVQGYHWLTPHVGFGVGPSTLYLVANLQNNGSMEFANQTNPHLQGPRIPCADSQAGYLF